MGSVCFPISFQVTPMDRLILTLFIKAKPNFGHSEGASGLTSIIKTVLALENKIIPPKRFATLIPITANYVKV